MLSVIQASVFRVLLFLLLYSGSTASPQTCYATDDSPYLYFGSQTAYEFARNPAGIPVVPGCRARQVWMVARHGVSWGSPQDSQQFTSLPDLRDQVIKNHQLGRGTLCSEDLEILGGWRQFLVSGEEAARLTPQGHRDAHGLGSRLGDAFPALMRNNNSSAEFVFRHTEMHVTKETAEFFSKGLFGDDFTPEFPQPVNDDRLLEAFGNCPAWSRKNDKLRHKVERFTRDSLMQQVYQNVSLRLGFNYDLPYYVVDAIYTSCSQEKAWSVDSLPAWCSAFTQSELEVLEYLQDLQFSYKTGHGDHTGKNNKLGCPLVRDMFMRFMEIENSPNASHPAGVFYFGQAETVGLTATRLGLMADHHPLTPTSYSSHTNRRYRSSDLVPFNGNILAVFYECSVEEQFRVMFLVSEHVVDYPGCPAGLCPWSLLKHKFGRIIRSSSCSDDFCFRGPGWLHMSVDEMWAVIAVAGTVLFVIYLFRAVNKLTD